MIMMPGTDRHSQKEKNERGKIEFFEKEERSSVSTTRLFWHI
jgi:hypothetical protein